MRIQPWYSLPAALYARAIALDLLPRRDADAIATPLYGDGERRPAAYHYEVALLGTALLTGERRHAAQRRVMADAQGLARRSAALGLEAFAEIIPVLDAPEAGEIGALAQRTLEHIAPVAGLRDAVRVVAQERYAAWLRDSCADLLAGAWQVTSAMFLERVSRLHLLTSTDRDLACRHALAGLPLLVHDSIAADREAGMGGAPLYTEGDVRAADGEARREALRALAPFLPAALHARARELGAYIEPLLGSWLDHAHTHARHWRAWFKHASIQIPSYTLAEKHTALRALPGHERDALIDTVVTDMLALLDGRRLDRRYGPSTGAHPSTLQPISG